MIFEPDFSEREACALLYLRQRGLSRSRDLLDLWYFEKWRKGGFHSPLCLWAQLFEAFSAIGTVFELAAVCLLSEPFSAVPTFHYCCNTHTRLFTSTRLGSSSPTQLPSRDLRATIISVPPRVARARSENMKGVMTLQTGPTNPRRAMLRMFIVTCSDIAVYNANPPTR